MTQENILSLAKFLIGLNIDLPDSVSQPLVSSPLVSEVISSFLCGAENIKFSPQGLHAFVNLDMENCIKECAKTDITVVMLLVDAIQGYKQVL